MVWLIINGESSNTLDNYHGSVFSFELVGLWSIRAVQTVRVTQQFSVRKCDLGQISWDYKRFSFCVPDRLWLRQVQVEDSFQTQRRFWENSIFQMMFLRVFLNPIFMSIMQWNSLFLLEKSDLVLLIFFFKEQLKKKASKNQNPVKHWVHR